jgi:hypothetical protein
MFRFEEKQDYEFHQQATPARPPDGREQAGITQIGGKDSEAYVSLLK